MVAPDAPTLPADGIYERWDWPSTQAPVVACVRDVWTLLVQAEGLLLANNTVLEGLSAIGQLVAFVNDFNGYCAFVAADHGVIRRRFDPTDPESGGIGYLDVAYGDALPEETLAWTATISGTHWRARTS